MSNALQVRLFELVQEGSYKDAASLILEYVYDQEDVMEYIHQISCIATEFFDDEELVNSLDQVVRYLESSVIF